MSSPLNAELKQKYNVSSGGSDGSGAAAGGSAQEQ
jgi:hypothetical protein